MRYAIKTPEGKYINVIRPEQANHQPCFDYNALFPLFYPSERSDGVFYLKGDLYLAAMHQGVKGFEQTKDFRLHDDQGTTYVLDWKNRKASDMGVASVPIKEIIKRQLPDHLIPELWKNHRQIYIDHFAIKFHPFDFSINRFQDSGHEITDLQSVILDGIYYAVGRYISGEDKTLRFVNDKIRAVEHTREEDKIPHTLEMIRPLVLDPIRNILVDNEIFAVHDRLVKVRKKIYALIEHLSTKHPKTPKNK